MTDENGGFFSDADNSSDSYDSGYSYESPAPATESDPQLQQGDANTQQQQAVNQPNPEYEALKQKYDALEKKSSRWDDVMTRYDQVFNPQQQQDPQQLQQAQALQEWEQKLQSQATNAAVQQLEYTMAEREVLQKYPQLNNVQHLIRNDQNIQQGFAQFQQKNGRPPQTPSEQVQAAVDSFMSSVGWTNQAPQSQQSSNTIPLNLRSHNPSREFDPSTASSEDFHKFVQAKLAKQYQ